MRRCACGCGKPVVDRRDDALYLNDAHKTRAARDRAEVREMASLVTATTRLARLKPAARRVVRALMAAGGRGATTAELGQAAVGGFRFGARIWEARKAGFEIDKRCERPGSYRYWLRSDGQTLRLLDVTPAREHAPAREEIAA